MDPTTPTPVNERERAKALLDGQNHILNLINTDRPLQEILATICLTIEAQNQGMLCSVLLLDEQRQCLLNGAAPSLPQEFSEAIHGISIGPNIGSCGTAAYTGKPAIVEDVATDERWAAFRELAYVRHGLRACWSTPIRSYEGEVIATFAMYYRTPKLPSRHERKLIEFSSHLVCIAVNRQRARASLATTED